jgi:branched-chain amino acid aminotransferase
LVAVRLEQQDGDQSSGSVQLERRAEIQRMEYVWMNGEVVSWEQATVPVMSHALHYGTAVFEGIRGYWSSGNLLLFRLHDHFVRLLDSAKVFDLETTYKAEELERATLDLLRANKMKEDCYIRPIIFVGFSGINLSFQGYPVNAAIVAFPFKQYFSKAGLDTCVSTWTRLYDPVTPPMAKISGNYVNSVFAKREAGKNGYDEAIMLNHAGLVSEGTGENIFLVKKGRVYTPHLGSSILEGLTRNAVMELAQELGLPVVERDIGRSELYTSEEIFLTGTAAGIAPVLTVDRKPVGSGEVGPVTKKLMQAYSTLVLGKITYSHDNWITRVY